MQRRTTRKGKTTVKNVKITVVGSGGVGKTSLILVYANEEFPTTHEATIFDSKSVLRQFENETVSVDIHDTAGQEDYANLRPLGYPGTSVFILCFAINNRNSFEKIARQWVPEIVRFDFDAKIILIGTKSDLKSPDEVASSSDEVTWEEGQTLAKKLKLKGGYWECSSKTNSNVKTVFDNALKLAFNKRIDKGRKNPRVHHVLRRACNIL